MKISIENLRDALEEISCKVEDISSALVEDIKELDSFIDNENDDLQFEDKNLEQLNYNLYSSLKKVDRSMEDLHAYIVSLDDYLREKLIK